MISYTPTPTVMIILATKHAVNRQYQRLKCTFKCKCQHNFYSRFVLSWHFNRTVNSNEPC